MLLWVWIYFVQDMSNFYAQYKSIKPYLQTKDGQCDPPFAVSYLLSRKSVYILFCF
jgi:succinate dehydrogenase/fumarate reductase-like Fe-S protein